MWRRKEEVCVLGEIEDGRRGDGGQLKDHPMRGDLKASVRFYEIGLCATHVCTLTQIHAQAHIYILPVMSLKQKLCLNLTAPMFLSLKNPQAHLRYRAAGMIFKNIVIQEKLVHF